MEINSTSTDTGQATNGKDDMQLNFDFLDLDGFLTNDAGRDAELQLEVKKLAESLNLPDDIKSVPCKQEPNGKPNHEDLIEHLAMEKERIEKEKRFLRELKKQSRYLEIDLANHENHLSKVMGNLLTLKMERDQFKQDYQTAEKDIERSDAKVKVLEVELSMFKELKKKRKVDLEAREEVWDRLSGVNSEIKVQAGIINEQNEKLYEVNSAMRKKRAFHRHLLKILTDFARELNRRGFVAPNIKEKFFALNEELKLEYCNNPELEAEISKVLKLKVSKKAAKTKRNGNEDVHLSSTTLDETPTKSSNNNELSSNEHNGFKFEANEHVCEIDSSPKRTGRAMKAFENAHSTHGRIPHASSNEKFDYEDHFFDVNQPIASDDEVDISLRDIEHLRKQVLVMGSLKAVSPIPQGPLLEKFSEVPTGIDQNLEGSNHESDSRNQHLASYRKGIESQHVDVASSSSVNESPKRPQLLHQHSEGFSFEQNEPSNHSTPHASSDLHGSFICSPIPNRPRNTPCRIVAEPLSNGILKLNFPITDPLRLELYPESLNATLTYGSFNEESGEPPFKKVKIEKDMSGQYLVDESIMLVEHSKEQLSTLSQNNINVPFNSPDEFKNEQRVANCSRKKARVEKHEELSSDDLQFRNNSGNKNPLIAGTRQTDTSKDVFASLKSTISPRDSEDNVNDLYESNSMDDSNGVHVDELEQTSDFYLVESRVNTNQTLIPTVNSTVDELFQSLNTQNKQNDFEVIFSDQEETESRKAAHVVDSPEKCKLVKVTKRSPLKSKQSTPRKKKEMISTVDDSVKASKRKQAKFSNECGKKEETAYAADSLKKGKLVKVTKRSPLKSKPSTRRKTKEIISSEDDSDSEDSEQKQAKSSNECEEKETAHKVTKHSLLKSKQSTRRKKKEIISSEDDSDSGKDSKQKQSKSCNEGGKEEEAARAADSPKKCKIVEESKCSPLRSIKSTLDEKKEITASVNHNDIVKDLKWKQVEPSEEINHSCSIPVIDQLGIGNDNISNECGRKETIESEGDRQEGSKFSENSELIEENVAVNNEIEFPSIFQEAVVVLVPLSIENLSEYDIKFLSCASKSKNEPESFVIEDKSNDYLVCEPKDNLESLEKTNNDSLKIDSSTDFAFCSNESISEPKDSSNAPEKTNTDSWQTCGSTDFAFCSNESISEELNSGEVSHNEATNDDGDEAANDDGDEEFVQDASPELLVDYEEIRSNLLRALRRVEKARLDTIAGSLDKCHNHLTKVLHEPKNFLGISTSYSVLLLAVIEYLTKSKKTPLLYYSPSATSSSLLPALEECITSVLWSLQENVKGAFEDLLQTAMSSLYFIIPFKDQIQICGLSALCRVFTKICRTLDHSINPLMLCSRLLKMKHKYAPYLIASIAGVWREIFQGGITKIPDVENLFLQCLAYGAAQRPKGLNDCQWNSCIAFLSKNLCFPTRFDVRETCSTVKNNILKLVQKESFGEFDFMLSSPLVILSAFQSWTWIKENVLDIFLLPFLKRHSTEVPCEEAFKLFCHIYTDILMLRPEKDSDHPFLMSLFLHYEPVKGFSYVQTVTACSVLKLCLLKKQPLPKCINEWVENFTENTKPFELLYLVEVGYSIQEDDLSSEDIIIRLPRGINDI